MFLDQAFALLEKRFPDAPAAEIRRVGYAITQLGEGASALAGMGFDPEQIDAARATAEALLRQLESFSQPDSSNASGRTK